MSERYGPRIAPGGYQAPSTNAVTLRRGKPVQERTWTIGTTHVELQVIPFEGGRPELFEVMLRTNDRVLGHSEYIPCMLRGAELAKTAFAMTAGELDAGHLPDRIILPANAPIGW